MSKLIIEIFNKNNAEFKGSLESDNDLINVGRIKFLDPFLKQIVAEIDTDKNKYFDKHLIQILLNNVNNIYNNLKNQVEFKISNPNPNELKSQFSAFIDKWTFGDNVNNAELTYFDNELNKKSISREALYLVNKNQKIQLEIIPDPIELTLPILSFIPKEINSFIDAPITEEFNQIDYSHELTIEQLNLLNKISIEKTNHDKIKSVSKEYKLIKQNERINMTINRRELNNLLLIRGCSLKNYIQTAKIFLKAISKLLKLYNFKLSNLKKQFDKSDSINIEQFTKIYESKEIIEKLIFETDGIKNTFTKIVKILVNKSSSDQLKEWSKNKFNNIIEKFSCNNASASMNYNIFVVNKDSKEFFDILEEKYKEKLM